MSRRGALALVTILFAAALAGCTKADDAARATPLVPAEDDDAPPASAPGSSSRPPSSASRPASPPASGAPTPGGPSGDPAPQEPTTMPVARAPAAVIAFIDTGINPYHTAFRDASPRALAHPSTYLEGYPADARPLALTLDAASLEDALKADCETWLAVEEGVLYYVPGTRIVGAISLPAEFATSRPIPALPERAIDCERVAQGRARLIFDEDGHGTMSASRAAGAPHGACPTCLVVAVQNFGAAQVAWAAGQRWVDAQSNSWGPVAMVAGPADTMLLTDSPALARAVEAAAKAQLSFWATGNGLAGRFGALGHPTQASPHFTPSVVRVGGHDNGRVNLWPGTSPHVVSDSCSNWAADADSLDGWGPTVGSGTSSAAPFVAGAAARVLLEVREALGDVRTGEREGGVLAQGAPTAAGPLSDGALTREELLGALLRTADARPDPTTADGVPCEPTDDAPWGAAYSTTPVEWRSVPDGAAGIPFVGYGAVTLDTVHAARRVLLGEAGMPARADEDAFFGHDGTARRTVHGLYAGLP